MSVSGTRPHEVWVWKGTPGTDGRAASYARREGSPHKRRHFSEERFAEQGAVRVRGAVLEWEFGGERKPTPSSVSRGLRCKRWGDKQCNLIQINPR